MLTTAHIERLLKFPPPAMQKSHNNLPELVMDYFKDNKSGTSQEVSDYTGLAVSTVNKIMRNLAKDNQLTLQVQKKQYRNSCGGITTKTINEYHRK